MHLPGPGHNAGAGGAGCEGDALPQWRTRLALCMNTLAAAPPAPCCAARWGTPAAGRSRGRRQQAQHLASATGTKVGGGVAAGASAANKSAVPPAGGARAPARCRRPQRVWPAVVQPDCCAAAAGGVQRHPGAHHALLSLILPIATPRTRRAGPGFKRASRSPTPPQVLRGGYAEWVKSGRDIEVYENA